jgi:hypothetical protein
MQAEVQHRQWRDDIRKNAESAVKAAREGDTEKAATARAVITATSNIILAERISELAAGIARSDELVESLYDANGGAARIIDRMLRVISNLPASTDQEPFEMVKAEAEVWLSENIVNHEAVTDN